VVARCGTSGRYIGIILTSVLRYPKALRTVGKLSFELKNFNDHERSHEP